MCSSRVKIHFSRNEERFLRLRKASASTSNGRWPLCLCHQPAWQRVMGGGTASIMLKFGLQIAEKEPVRPGTHSTPSQPNCFAHTNDPIVSASKLNP